LCATAGFQGKDERQYVGKNCLSPFEIGTGPQIQSPDGNTVPPGATTRQDIKGDFAVQQ